MSSKIEGCCCPPKGYSEAWAAGPCPVHQGLRRLADPVERRPVAVIHKNMHGCKRAILLQEGMRLGENTKLYTAPPELAELQATRKLAEDSCNELVSRCLEHADKVAELQATIAQLTAENERLEREAKNDLVAYKAAIERQKEIRADADYDKGKFEEWQASHHANYCMVASERDQLKAEIERLKGGQREPVATIHWQQPSCDWTLTMLCEPAIMEAERLNLYMQPAPLSVPRQFDYDRGFSAGEAERETLKDELKKAREHSDHVEEMIKRVSEGWKIVFCSKDNPYQVPDDTKGLGLSYGDGFIFAHEQHEPAPVSVVLPEPEQLSHAAQNGKDQNFSTGYSRGWNACLDKVKELNK